MKKKVFSLMMTLLLAFIGVAKAETIEIGTGTSTTYYVPFNSLYGYSFTEQVYSASDIGTAGSITSISFHLGSSYSTEQTNQIALYMKNVSRSSFSSTSDYETVTTGDMVYSGMWTIPANYTGWVTITLDTPFAYDGTSNLMVAMHESTSGYSTRYFTYTSVTNASVQWYSDSYNPNPYDLSSYSGSSYTRNYLANAQLEITAGGGAGAGNQIFAVQDGEIVETVEVGERPNGCWMEPFVFQIRNTGAPVTVTNLDWTPNTYFTLADDELLPFALSHNAEQDIALNTGDAQGNTDWQMVAIYGTGRTAAVWNIHVDAYDPAIPDVVEMAYDFGTIAAGFSYQGVPSQITPTTLHNDYTLPFPEIEEGVDESDMILNAYVDENAENGKVALYTEDFYGEGGPMADNNYTGLNLNGGSGGSGGGGAAFQAQIGEGTSTSTYFPFHTLWNYSLAENLFLASELTEAGVTTAPMTSLSWYVSSTSCTTPQNNISIWMANVSDAALTTTSHTTDGMTLVYTGNSVLPTAGEWNEFVFNAGNFAWDGHSNILILCTRNNGSYQGSISWQTHNPGFLAMTYSYSDTNGGYYVATAPQTGMYTSTTNRANIIFKGGNRENTRDVVLNEGFEGGSMPAGWTQEGNGTWSVGSGDYSTSTGSATGTYNALITHGSTGNVTYLITPAMDLSNATSATVSCNYINRSWAGDIDGFGICYRVNGGAWNELFSTTTAHSTWTATGDIALQGMAANYQIGFRFTDEYGYGVGLDDIVVNATISGGGTPTPGPTPGPTPTPTPGITLNVSAGPVIENLGLTPGTYYLVASATEADYDVYINVDQMPCPAVNADDYAFNPTPADDQDEVEPGSVTLRWTNPQYATEWRLVFGSTYYPDPNHDQTIITDWSSNMATSYTVTNLWNNTNYFWHIQYRNAACMDGVSSPIVGFTTHLNIPTNLTAEDYTVFNDEEIVLHWNAVVDRTYRMYFIYRDGVKIGQTQVNNIGATTFTDGPLAYNMGGYTYYVTAIYDEGESAPSDPVTVKVSGYGDVNGHVYEQDGTTGIANAIVTMVGTDEFGDPHTYTFPTDGNGYYSGHIYAGVYDGSAACNGYQGIDAPVQGNPINIDYNQTTSPIDYIMDENFDPVCQVIAEYYPDSLDPNSPYVKVYWGCGLPGSEIIEDFETGDFSQFDWQVDPTYPWSITTTNPYEGTYCMKSGGAGVANVVSNMTVTVNIPNDGLMSFFGKISCENSWDYGYFYIDGVQMGSYTGAGQWAERTFDITAGDHTFQWRYTKDSSVNSNDDCFYVDYINFYKQPEPAVPGMTYDFDNSTMQGWTSVDADGDGYGWYVASEIMSTGYGHNGSNDCVLSQSYNNSVGVLYPDNYLVSPQVQLGGIVRFYACAQDASYAAEHFGVAVSTTNTQPGSFTTIQEWTMSAKSVDDGGKAVLNSRSGRAQGNWYEYTVDLSAYSGMGYVAIRHFNCSDMFYLDVDDITIGEPGKSIAENRSLHHYRVYRTNCYNDGPYEEPTTVLLASVWVPDTVYIDVEWADLPAGVYKWGVGSVYSGNRGEEIEGEIVWSEPVGINPEMNNRDVTVDFETGTLPEGWTIIQNTNAWYVGDQGNYGNPAAAYGGTYAAFVNGSGTSGDDYLVSPALDFNGSGSVSFAYVTPSWAGDINTLAVAYSTSATGPWTTVWGPQQSTSWTTANVPLSLNGTYYLAFVSHNNYGYCTGVDDITISGAAGGGGSGGGGGNTGGLNGPGGEPIQLERESVIVWSNCLDKDMYLDNVTVTVLLNSADSPEGTTVSFVNTNEYEQETYGGYNLTLDGSGFYAFDSFRRGEYNISVRHEGYEPIDETRLIWDNEDLRYVMIEILYGVENVYVSRTGWAMWEDSHNNPGGNTPGGGQGGNGDTFSVDFEGGLPAGWSVIDGNNDGWTWCATSAIPSTWTYYAGIALDWYHSGTDAMCSGSYINGVGALTPDEYLVSPMVNLANGSTLSFWVAATDASYAADHFGVFVSDNGTSNWTSVQEWTLTAKKSGLMGGAGSRDGNGLRLGNWYNYSVDLSAYAGQKYIAFRHFDCYDQYIMCLDDVELTTGAKSGNEMQHLEYYKVMCTSVDGVPIYNHNTVWPFCQLSTNEPYNAPLVEGEHYLCKVAAVYSTGISAWSEPVEWQYEPCDHWGPVDEVTATTVGQGNLVEWVFDHGFNPYGGDTPGPQPGGATSFTEGFENGLNGWNVLTVLADGGSWIHSDQNLGGYDYTTHAHGGTGFAMCYSFVDYVGSYNTDSYMYTPQKYTITNGSTLSFFADNANDSYPENFSVCIATADNPTAADFTTVWSGGAKGNGGEKAAVRHDGNRYDNWRAHSIDLSAYAGQNVYIAFHDVNYDMYEIWIDDVTLTPGAKGEYNAMESGMLNSGAYALNITDIANYDERVYFLHNLSKDVRFDVINGEAAGMFIVSTAAGYEDIDLEEAIREFSYNNSIEFGQMDKVQAAETALAYKAEMPMSFTNSLMMDIYAQSRENNMCEFADPFCTDNGMYEFPAGVNAGSGETGPDYDCLYTTPNPAWYYMRIGDPGSMNIHMYSTPQVDIDFCCWGPFDDPTTPCPYGLTEDKVVSCSYSTSWTENCIIPATAQTGEYYILVITNYSNQACNINFSMIEGSGSTDCGILPPVDIIGFLITMDGEYLAFAGPTDRDYLHEGEFGEHEYCVRPIYPGEMTLPSNNFGWSMGCPVCATNGDLCTPGAPIHGEALNETDQAKVWWGDQNPGPGGCEGDEFTLNFDDSQMPAGWTTVDEDGDGFNWILGSGCDGIYLDGGNLAGAGHNASADLIVSGSYSNVYGALNPDNWLISPVVTLCENSTFSFWACGQDASYVAEHFGVAVSEDGGNSFAMVQEWTMTAKSNGSMGIGRDGNYRAQGNWHQYTVDLGNYAGEGRKIAIRHFNCTDMFILDVDDIELSAGAKGTRAAIVSYNVYRSTENANYTLIGNVPAVAGQTYYEYIDTPAVAGTYYYQVTAVYAACESEPAQAANNPNNDYVMVVVGGDNVDENIMAIFPNPTKGNVTILANGMRHITVVSMLGQVVFDADVEGDNYIMNMSQYTAGVYTVRVTTENGVSAQRITVVR